MCDENEGGAVPVPAGHVDQSVPRGALEAAEGFVQDGQPYVTPTIHAREGETIYMHGANANRTFRVRQSGSSWKVLDVLYLNGVSELASKRSDFSATIDKGGADALVKKINALADGLLKG